MSTLLLDIWGFYCYVLMFNVALLSAKQIPLRSIKVLFIHVLCS